MHVCIETKVQMMIFADMLNISCKFQDCLMHLSSFLCILFVLMVLLGEEEGSGLT